MPARRMSLPAARRESPSTATALERSKVCPMPRLGVQVAPLKEDGAANQRQERDKTQIVAYGAPCGSTTPL